MVSSASRRFIETPNRLKSTPAIFTPFQTPSPFPEPVTEKENTDNYPESDIEKYKGDTDVSKRPPEFFSDLLTSLSGFTEQATSKFEVFYYAINRILTNRFRRRPKTRKQNTGRIIKPLKAQTVTINKSNRLVSTYSFAKPLGPRDASARKKASMKVSQGDKDQRMRVLEEKIERLERVLHLSQSAPPPIVPVVIQNVTPKSSSARNKLLEEIRNCKLRTLTAVESPCKTPLVAESPFILSPIEKEHRDLIGKELKRRFALSRDDDDEVEERQAKKHIADWESVPTKS